MRCSAMIIDDEPLARETLRLLIRNYCPQLRVEAECKNAEDALLQLQSFLPDIIFLDIQMPGKSGIDLAREIEHLNCNIVFTTAYNRYAINAFRLGAIDYLLKPIDPEQLIQAVHRCQTKGRKAPNAEQLQVAGHHYLQQEQRIALPSLAGLDIYRLEDIVCFSADESYCEVWLADKSRKLISRKLGDMEDLLLESGFFRLHKSYLVNIRHIVKSLKAKAVR